MYKLKYVVMIGIIAVVFLLPNMVYASSNNDNDDDDDLPTCKNGVVQDCKVKGGI